MAMNVGFVGLGRMGKPICLNILSAGFNLTIYDICDEPMTELAQAGARRARDLKELGRHSDIVAVAVVDDPQVEEVMLGDGGILESLRPGTVVVIHSTIMPATVMKLAELAMKKNIRVVDAPMSGGEQGAMERQLCYMVGGERRVFEQCRPLLEASAAHVFHMGELGSGATAKIILQVLVCSNMLAAYEAELLCGKTGLEFNVLQKVLSASSGQSFVVDHWLERFKRPFDPMPIRQRRTEVFEKSLAPALMLAQRLGVSLPGAALARDLLPRIMGLTESDKS